MINVTVLNNTSSNRFVGVRAQGTDKIVETDQAQISAGTTLSANMNIMLVSDGNGTWYCLVESI